MNTKKNSRLKKCLAIASSITVVSSLLLMFAGLNITRINDVKQVNNAQSQAMQNRSVQPKAAGAIEGDYLLDSNNAIVVRNSDGTPATKSGYSAMRSDGIGIGPKGYLMLNNDTSKFDYIGYDGKVIWSTTTISDNMDSNNPDAGWPIYVDYDDDLDVFTTWSKGILANGEGCLKFVAFNANTGATLYDYNVSNDVDFSSNNFQDVLITKMANTPSDMVGYTVMQAEKKGDPYYAYYSTFYFGKNNKPESAPKTTSFITSGIQFEDGNAWMSSKERVNSERGLGRFIRAKSFYKDGDYYFFGLMLYTGQTRSMQFFVQKNGISTRAYKQISIKNNSISNGHIFSSKEGAIYEWSNGVDLQFYINLSSNNQFLLLLNYDWKNNAITTTKVLDFNTASNIDFDSYSYRFYKNTFYGYGGQWDNDVSHYDRIMILNLGSENSQYIGSNDKFDISSNNMKIVDVPGNEILGSSHSTKGIGLFPSYSPSDRPFTNVNLNLNGIRATDNLNNAILSITPDGNFAYNTKFLGNEIDISSNETLKNLTATKVTQDQIKEEIIKDDFKLLRQVLTRFNSASEITVAASSDWSSAEQQNLYAQGKISLNVIVSQVYGNVNGDLSSTTSEREYGPIIFSGFKPIPNTLIIDDVLTIAGNQVNIAEVSLGSNKVNTITPSDVNEEQLKTWMQNNWQQYIDENTVPFGFTDTNIHKITITNKNNNDGTVTAQFTLDQSFENSTYLTTPKSFEVIFTGFNGPINNTELISDTVDASILQINNTSPYQLSQNLEDLKTKISGNANQIFIDLVNNSLSVSDINLQPGDVSISGATSLQVSLTIPAYIDNVEKTKKFTITINNLADKQTSIDNDVTVNGELANLGNKDSQVEQLLKQFIINNTQYWEMNATKPTETDQTVIINSALEQLQLSDIDLRIIDTNTPGQVTATVKLMKYIDASGQYIDTTVSGTPLSQTVVFKGFNDTKPGETSIKGVDVSTLNSSTAQQLAGFYIGDVKDGMHNDVFKEFMLDASNGVISSIPTGLSASDISNIVWSKASENSLSLTVTLAKWYDSYGVLQTTEKPFTSTTNFSGFKTDTTQLKNANGLDAIDLNLNTFAPYELTNKKTEIQKYIFDNYKNIFINYAEAKMADASKITIGVITPTSSTEASVQITMPGYENGWANDSTSHTIKITNLQDKDTKFIDTIDITSNPTLSALDAKTVTAEQIKAYIDKNQKIIFKDKNSIAPEGYTLGVTKDSFDNAIGLVVITISIDKYVENGTLKTSPKKTGSINVVGFKNSSTTLKKSSIGYDETLFKKIFNGYSTFSSDWALTNYVNLTEAATKLKDYMNNNKSEMFNNISNNTIVESVIIAAPSNDVAKATINYKGWLDGKDNATLNGIIQIRLKSTPTNIDYTIRTEVQAMYRAAANKPTDGKGLADFIQKDLKNRLGSRLPQNMLDNIVIHPEKIETTDRYFVLNDGAITLNGTNISGFSIELKDPNDSLIVGSTDDNTWIWILIGVLEGVLLIVLIIVIAIIIRRRNSNLRDDDI